MLYSDRIVTMLHIEPPFEVQRYISTVRAAVEAGYHIFILDSISHALAGEGGLIDVQSKLSVAV